MNDVNLSPETVEAIREQIARQLKQEVARVVEEAVTEAFNPQLVARRQLQLESQRRLEAGMERARALVAAAPEVKRALMDEAAKYGPIQLRFTSVEAPAELQYVPCFPSHAFRR